MPDVDDSSMSCVPQGCMSVQVSKQTVFLQLPSLMEGLCIVCLRHNSPSSPRAASAAGMGVGWRCIAAPVPPAVHNQSKTGPETRRPQLYYFECGVIWVPTGPSVFKTLQVELVLGTCPSRTLTPLIVSGGEYRTTHTHWQLCRSGQMQKHTHTGVTHVHCEVLV